VRRGIRDCSSLSISKRREKRDIQAEKARKRGPRKKE